MLFTHSWLTEPHSPDLAHQIAKNGNLLCGFFVVIFFLFSLFVTKSNFHFKISGYVINIALYFLMAIFSDYFNNSSITVYEIMQLAIPIAFGLSFIYSFTKKDINKILFFISFFGLTNVILVYIVFFSNLHNLQTPFSISGLITDRNGFARYLSIINVFVLIEFILQKNKLRKILLGLILIFFFLGVLIQYSRSGYIVYFISVSLVLLMCESKSIKKISLFLLPVLLILFIVFTINRIHSEKMHVVDMSDIGRVYVAKAGINMIKAHPFKGIGYKMAASHIQDYAEKAFPGIDRMVAIHNWFIAIWAETGILGLIIFCWLNFSLIIACLRKFLQLGFSKGKHAFFSFIALIILIIDAQVLPNYDYESIYWIIIAIAVISISKIESFEYTLNTKSSHL